MIKNKSQEKFTVNIRRDTLYLLQVERQQAEFWSPQYRVRSFQLNPSIQFGGRR